MAINVITDDESILSPKFWYCYSQVAKERNEKKKFLEKAIETEPIRNGFKDDLKFAG